MVEWHPVKVRHLDAKPVSSNSGNPTVTVRATNVAFCDFFRYPLDAKTTRNHDGNLDIFHASYVIELQNHRVAFATVHAGVLPKVVDDKGSCGLSHSKTRHSPLLIPLRSGAVISCIAGLHTDFAIRLSSVRRFFMFVKVFENLRFSTFCTFLHSGIISQTLEGEKSEPRNPLLIIQSERISNG